MKHWIHPLTGVLLAVELICGAQAVDLHNRRSELGCGTAAAYAAVRAHIPFTGRGSAPSDDLGALVSWLESQQNGLT